MSDKKVIFIADSLDNAHKFKVILSDLGVDVIAGSSVRFKKILSDNPEHDLVIYELGTSSGMDMASVESLLVEENSPALLVIVRKESLEGFHLSARIKSDFVVSGATPQECSARISQLLWPASEAPATDIISIDSMTIDLATYQVRVNDEPLNLTYLEYALLAFLITHPSRTYSRQTLLRRVWGFDYCGGSRTVDVHVRRIRAKLGPEISQHLKTIRGVGYLWYA